MSNYLIKKTLVFVIIILFIGAIITPCISGNVSKMSDIKSEKTRDINNAIQTKGKEPHATSNTDWWSMFRHDSGNTACSSSIAPNTNQLCWKESISDEIYQATPIIYNNKLYMSTGWFYKDFEPTTIIDKSIFKAPDFTEFLNDYFTYNEDYYGGVYCLDAEKGTELWNYQLYLPNDPLIFENKVYVTDLNIYTASSSLYCLNAETGDLIWSQPVGSAVLRPTIGADDKIFLGCIDYFTNNGSLKCFDFDGNSLWTYPFPTNEFIGAAPAYCEGKVYFIIWDPYFFPFQGRLYCVNAENGDDIWDVLIFSYGSPVCKDGMVFAVDFNFSSYNINSKLMCFDADTGSLLCEYPFEVNSWVYQTPAVSQDSVFIVAFDLFSYSSWLYKIFINCTLDWNVLIPGGFAPFSSGPPICSTDKIFICPWSYYGYASTLYCMDIENGNVLWNFTLDHETEAYPSIADEKVYIADIFGNIYAFEDTLEIDKISGGILCAKAEIKNKGMSDLTDVSWSIDVNGGMFNMINKHAEGDISTLQGNSSKTVRAFPVFGLGNVEIQVSVGMPNQTPIKKNLNGIVLGLIVIIKS